MRCHLQFEGCHIYAKCGVINKECCDVILTRYYVINIVDTMSQLYWMLCNIYIVGDITDSLGVMTRIHWT